MAAYPLPSSAYMPTRPGMENHLLAVVERMPCLLEAYSLPYSEDYPDVQSCRMWLFVTGI